ncbi:efflux RND transporter permease subunit [Pseudactinotalea sp. Z1748]|uniref:efflux RND transporter permease subunit n=1 Tax=Pseudactinotalea sp. Z1748 TaxID=3413027 RepID=UPI003C7A5D51
MIAFARFSLRNRALVALAAIIAVLGGLWSAATLKQELIPDFELPIVVVITPYPGASPDVVDDQVSVPISQAATAVQGLESTTATSNANVSTVLLELAYGTEAGTAQQQMQMALSRLSLPEAADPQVMVGSFDDLPVVQLAVTAPEDPEQTVQTLRDVVVPELEALDGVRDVSLSGAVDEVVTIDVDAGALAMAGLSPDVIVSTLDSHGMVIPAGTLRDDPRALNVQVGEALEGVDDVAALPLRNAEGEVLRLDEVAEVSVEQEEATSFARTNGQTSFGLAVTATPEGNTVEISDQVADLLPELEQFLAEGAEISVIIDQAPFITQSVQDLGVEGMLGLIFAVIVILIFMRAWRPTGVTALSIPLSLLITIIGVNVVGYTLNLLTLAALTVSIGRVVDDSIVVIENIERHLSYGGPKHQAVLTGVREVGGAITSATVATAAVFVPIGLVGGLVGELFRPFAFTAAAALLVSLLVALTIVPVLAWWLLPLAKGAPSEAEPTAGAGQRGHVGAHEQAQERRGPLQRGYLATLRLALAHPVITLLIAAGLLGGTVALVPQMETEFIGDSGDNTVSIAQSLPSGTSLQARDEAAAQVEAILEDIEEVQTYQVTGGEAEGVMAFVGAGQDATFMVSLDLEADAAQVEQRLREELADLGSDAGELTVSPGQAALAGGVEVVVTAADSEDLADAAQQVRDAVVEVPDTTDVASNLAEDLATVTVSVDRDGAAEVGLSEAQVGQSVAAALNGIPLGQIITDTGEIDVVMQIGEAPLSMTELEELPVGTVPAEPAGSPAPGDAPGQIPGDAPTDAPEGMAPGDLPEGLDQPGPAPVGEPDPVLLADIAEVEEVDLPTSVTRSGGIQSATITASSTATDLGAQGAALQEALDDLHLPEGASVQVGGVMADQDEAFANLGLALLLSLAIVYLVMVGTFRSLVQPLILMISVPFAATGSIGLLLITGTPLGVAGLVGALMLVGVVVTNAIVLIDLINQYRRAGMGLARAIEDGARHRLRPILMTAFATMGALVPMALGITGGGAFISRPLALVVIGGLFTSTILTLVLVPVLYWLVEARKQRRGVEFTDVDAFDDPPRVRHGAGATTGAATPSAVAAAPATDTEQSGATAKKSRARRRWRRARKR